MSKRSARVAHILDGLDAHRADSNYLRKAIAHLSNEELQEISDALVNRSASIRAGVFELESNEVPSGKPNGRP